MSPKRTLRSILIAWFSGLALAGCGTMRSSDTQRTATEQFLISHAIDEAVGRMDFRVLSGKSVFFNEDYLEDTVQKRYLASSLRQQLLASGVQLEEKREDADYIVEARSGVVGTNRSESMFGVPALSLPPLLPGIPTSTPEVALAKKTNQQAAAKIAVYAWNRQTGRRVWQSGLVMAEAYEKNNWLFGIGPAQKSSYRDGTRFIGERVEVPFVKRDEQEESGPILLQQEAYWDEQSPMRGPEETIHRAEHTEPAEMQTPSGVSEANRPRTLLEPTTLPDPSADPFP
jgi:hypothetical protein